MRVPDWAESQACQNSLSNSRIYSVRVGASRIKATLILVPFQLKALLQGPRQFVGG